jgi:Fic family protein
VRERFRNSQAGRLVQAQQGEAAYWAFVPNPLPPPLPLDLELLRAQADASQAVGELAGLGRTLANPHLLIRPFVRREAVLSSRIEGTQAELADLYAYEAGQLSLPGQRPPEADVREVLNYVHALEYGIERLATLPVSLRLMRELHERLMAGVRGGAATPGEFRHSQNWIGQPGCTLAQADFVPPPPAEMQGALSDLEEYLHRDDGYPLLMRLAFVHYQFEAIHPFLDGNGRIGRLLLSLLSVHWGLLPLPLLYLSGYFESHRSDYYGLLAAVSERGAWRDWLLFFLRGVAEQARDANARAKRLQDLQIEWRRQLLEERSAGLLLRLVESLFKNPMLTVPQAQLLLGVTHRSAQHSVDKLVQVGILRPAGKSVRARVYVAPAIVDTVDMPLHAERNDTLSDKGII